MAAPIFGLAAEREIVRRAYARARPVRNVEQIRGLRQCLGFSLGKPATIKQIIKLIKYNFEFNNDLILNLIMI
jgi:hypothetical protein